MKKLLLILAVFFFTCMSANATVSVRYNNAGQPVSVTYGAGRPMSMAQAAQYSANRRHYHHHHPRIHRPVPYVGYGFNNGHVGPYVGVNDNVPNEDKVFSFPCNKSGEECSKETAHHMSTFSNGPFSPFIV